MFDVRVGALMSLVVKRGPLDDGIVVAIETNLYIVLMSCISIRKIKLRGNMVNFFCPKF